MIQPPSLKFGDKICIVSPSRTIQETQIKEAIDIFEAWGLQVDLGSHVYDRFGYFAGTDEQRLSDLQIAINNPDIKAIFCSRGGYGMSRILDLLNFDNLLNTPKWIVGFSDITALHIQLNNIGIQSIHGLMPVQFDYMGTEESLDSLKELLFNNKVEYQLPVHADNILGDASAEIIGGNLSLLTDCLGTKSEISTNGKILFVEEIDEYLYKIDRMFNQLKRANKLSKLKGLIVGDFSQQKDTNIPFGQTLEQIVLHHTSEFNYPVAFNIPIGHEPHNLAVPCGRVMKLNVSKSKVELIG
ncbi:S66 peptidase family protein [Fulvivirga lutimaris]|uniref:S66 peptidase family protein n=1 Tax=Fulvivirga lutimaris TaxID=1819566 RepID=UPI0012BB923B|nr:LD-carboxypeptidase [Fulvivirga lutimaris]MTI41303.1 LD-carboxypeptidase [Fulvivirga lutimaris]